MTQTTQPARTTRYATQIPCWVRDGESAFGAVVLNVSDGGLFIRAAASVADARALAVTLWPTPEAPRVDVTTRVVWREPDGVEAPATVRGVGLEIEQAPPAYYGIVRDASGICTVTCEHCDLVVTVALAAPDDPEHPFAYFAERGAAAACAHRQRFLAPGAPPERVPETCPELGKAVLGALTDGTLARR